MTELTADLRFALRSLRRAPSFALSAVAVVALAVGLCVPVLSLARAGLGAAVPFTDQAGGAEVEALLLPERVDAGLAGPSTQPWGRLPQVHPTPGAVPPTATARSVAHAQDEGMRSLLVILAALSALVLAAGAVNVGSLLLARGSARRQEVVMRAVLGAPRGVLARQLLAEGGVVALAGAGLGTVAAALGLHLLRATWPVAPPPWAALRPDALALGAVAGVLGLTALVVALSPARAASRRDLAPELSTARATAGPREGWRGRALVVFQVAATTTLLACGGVLARAFSPTAAAGEDPGFDPRDTLAVQVELAGAGFRDLHARVAWQQRVLDRVAALPGVRAASWSSAGAWMGMGTTDVVLAQGMAPFPNPPAVQRDAQHHAVTPGYFRGMGIPLLRGREFRAGDREGAAPVVVVSEAFAHTMLRGVDPIGKPVRLGGPDGTWYTVVGVVGSVRARGIGSGGAELAPAVYVSSLQHPPRALGLAVRTDGRDPLALEPAVRAAMAAAGSGAEVHEGATMAGRLARFALPLRWFARVIAALSALAVAMALVGLYGVMAYTVARRTREIGIRMAVGARAGQVVRMVVSQSLRLTARGIFFGLWGAFSLTRLLQWLFYGVDPMDPVVFGTMGALLAATALAAALIPARRAVRVDPMVALRVE